jgi:hypothetical protein
VKRRTLILALLLAACSGRPGVKLDGGTDLRIYDVRTTDLPPFTFPEAGDVRAADSQKATSDRCVGAIPLTFSAGVASHSGSTAGASNEFGKAIRCGESVAMEGPQRYHKLTLTSGKTYRVKLEPKFDARFYVFTECGSNIINVDCTSGGATGVFSGAIASGGSATLLFAPPATGGYRLAVDSLSSAQAGAYTLTVTEIPPPANRTCTKAQTLTLSGGKASVNGSTVGAANEFSTLVKCGTGLDFDGPQVYYSVALSQGSWYKLSLAPTFDGSLYLFDTRANCQHTNINADCGGKTGTVLPVVTTGSTRATAFYPATAGTYVVAVDSLGSKQAGDFSLSLESFTPPAGMTCAGATSLTLTSGKVSVQGSTASLFNDLGAHVSCGSASPLLGPQAYYTVSLQKTTYRLALKPGFSARLALGSSCSSLPGDCASGGLSGALLAVNKGTTGSLLFTPPAAGSHVVAVDSTSTEARGSYQLWIQEYVKPTNGVCSKPDALSTASSPAVELGDTGPLKNDLSGVSCGHKNGPFNGPQAYYAITLAGGKTYSVQLTPEATFDPALYAFPAATSCSATAVDAACKGSVSDTLGAGLKESLTLKPSSTTQMVLVVDSWSPSEVGSYSLTISWP